MSAIEDQGRADPKRLRELGIPHATVVRDGPFKDEDDAEYSRIFAYTTAQIAEVADRFEAFALAHMTEDEAEEWLAQRHELRAR